MLIKTCRLGCRRCGSSTFEWWKILPVSVLNQKSTLFSFEQHFIFYIIRGPLHAVEEVKSLVRNESLRNGQLYSNGTPISQCMQQVRRFRGHCLGKRLPRRSNVITLHMWYDLVQANFLGFSRHAEGSPSESERTTQRCWISATRNERDGWMRVWTAYCCGRRGALPDLSVGRQVTLHYSQPWSTQWGWEMWEVWQVHPSRNIPACSDLWSFRTFYVGAESWASKNSGFESYPSSWGTWAY